MDWSCVGSAGEGPELLFITGTDGDLLRHPAVDPFFDVLTDRFAVRSYDQRGLGSTSKPPGRFTMADYARDACEVLDAAGLDSVAVVGYSFGGMVAQVLAITHPERVSRLALVRTASGGAGGSSYAVVRLSGLPIAVRQAKRMALWDTRHDEQWQQHHPGQVADWVEEWSAFELDTAAVPGQPAGSDRQLAARREHDTFDRLSEIGVATLVLGGVWDGIAPFDRQMALARRIPDATIAMFDGGHRVLWQDPRATALVADFLAH